MAHLRTSRCLLIIDNMVASAISDFFEGDIASFLQVLEPGPFIFDEIRDLLAQQLARLTLLEREIMDWLASKREPVPLSELQANFIRPIAAGELLQALTSLQRRSFIEKVTAGFAQQPVVMEYVKYVKTV